MRYDPDFDFDEFKKILFWPIIVVILIVVILAAESCEKKRTEIPVVPIEMEIPEEIRVIIMNDRYTSLYQQQVTLLSDGGLRIIAGDDEIACEAGKEYQFNKDTDIFRKGVVRVEPEKAEKLIKVTDLKRESGTPEYPGYFELELKDKGIVLVNIVPFEEYIARVVPSEMPAKYNEEALKVQAVCARTYCLMQIAQNSYTNYDADVDDSINFQVYNNVGENKRATKAAKDTAGQIITHEGKLAEALYFSTSCGYTTDATIWGSKKEDVPHIRARAVAENGDPEKLTDNKYFEDFIRNKTHEDSYEKDYQLYRWIGTVDMRKLNIPEKVGELYGIFVTERGDGGLVKKLQLVGSKGEVTISGDSRIRAFLGRGIENYKLNDGSVKDMGTSLPSGFFAIDQTGKEGKRRIFTVWGGGYGHGVGMSQNGANAMAKKGLNYKEILKRFYTDIDISKAE